METIIQGGYCKKCKSNQFVSNGKCIYCGSKLKKNNYKMKFTNVNTKTGLF